MSYLRISVMQGLIKATNPVMPRLNGSGLRGMKQWSLLKGLNDGKMLILNLYSFQYQIMSLKRYVNRFVCLLIDSLHPS